jgi:hypothetical protein
MRIAKRNINKNPGTKPRRKYSMSLSPEVMTLFGTLCGVIVGALAGFAGAWVQNRAAVKQSLMAASGQLALEDWRFRTELAREVGGAVKPPAISMFYAMKMCELTLASRGKSDAAIRKELRDISATLAILSAHTAEAAEWSADDEADDRNG